MERCMTVVKKRFPYFVYALRVHVQRTFFFSLNNFGNSRAMIVFQSVCTQYLVK